MKISFLPFSLILLTVINFCCNDKNAGITKEMIAAIDLKRGEVISCGVTDNELGALNFEISCKEVNEDFNLAVKLLHSFEYDEAEKVFASIIDKNPGCAMAYWGVAMSNFHPLWAPPTEAELLKGTKAVDIAKKIKNKTKKETEYIEAIASFYKNYKEQDHKTRCINFEKSMENLHATYPDDHEAAIFYALSLNAAADPSDKTFAKQKKAGSILFALYKTNKQHPGIVHYIIHTYDFPELALYGLPAAREYASVAPSSAHALHMPSHIFTRMGLWDECISSNVASVYSAKCYAEESGIDGHWDEELHGMDYLVYAYLQKGENEQAKKQWDYLKTITKAEPLNFKVAYAYAAIPARYLLENKRWKEAADLQPHDTTFPWNKFNWQKAIIHFTRLLGAVHTKNTVSAKNELKELKAIYNNLLQQKDAYKANQVLIQIKAAEALMMLNEGKNTAALDLMTLAADMEDKTEKHPVTPGEVLPAKEMLAEMYLTLNQPEKALLIFEENLKKHPNRFNGLYGAGLAAEKCSDYKKATYYYNQLKHIVGNNRERPELKKVNEFLRVNSG